MQQRDVGAQASRGNLARSLAGQTQCPRDRLAEQRIPQCGEHQRQCRFGNLMVLMFLAQLVDERADRLENRVQRVAIARR